MDEKQWPRMVNADNIYVFLIACSANDKISFPYICWKYYSPSIYTRQCCLSSISLAKARSISYLPPTFVLDGAFLTGKFCFGGLVVVTFECVVLCGVMV